MNDRHGKGAPVQVINDIFFLGPVVDFWSMLSLLARLVKPLINFDSKPD